MSTAQAQHEPSFDVELPNGLTEIEPDFASRSRILRGLRWATENKAIASLADQATVSAANFATSILLARFTNQSELGSYYLCMSVLFFSRGLQEQLVGGPLMVFLPRISQKERRTFVGSVTLHFAILCLSLTAVAVMVGVLGAAPKGAQEVCFPLVFMLPLMLSREYAREVCFSDLKPQSAFRIDVLSSAIQLTLLVALGRAGMLSFQSACYVIAIAFGAPTLLWWLRNRASIEAKWPNVWDDWRHNFRFSRWTCISYLVGCSGPYVLPWVTNGVHGPDAAGAFGAASTLVGIANMFVLGMCNFLAPKAASAYHHGGRKALLQVVAGGMGLFVVVIGSLFLIALLAGEVVSTLVYGEHFHGIGPVVAVLCFGQIANSLGMVAGNGLWAMERPKSGLAADIGAFVTTMAVAFVAIRPYGPFGAALATTIGISVGACIRIALLAHAMWGPEGPASPSEDREGAAV